MKPCVYLTAQCAAQVNPAATLSVGEVQLEGSCGVMDPEVTSAPL